MRILPHRQRRQDRYGLGSVLSCTDDKNRVSKRVCASRAPDPGSVTAVGRLGGARRQQIKERGPYCPGYVRRGSFGPYLDIGSRLKPINDRIPLEECRLRRCCINTLILNRMSNEQNSQRSGTASSHERPLREPRAGQAGGYSSGSALARKFKHGG